MQMVDKNSIGMIKVRGMILLVLCRVCSGGPVVVLELCVNVVRISGAERCHVVNALVMLWLPGG